MGFLRREATKVVMKAARNSGVLDKIYIPVQKAVGLQDEKELLKKTKRNSKKLIIKVKNRVSNHLVGDYYKKEYSVYDENGNLFLRLEGIPLVGEHYYDVFDSNSIKVARLERHLVAINYPFEKETKECTIYINDKEYCTARTCWNLNKWVFELDNSNYSINMDINRMGFEIKKESSVLARCQRPIANDGNDYNTVYVVDFKNNSMAMRYALIAIAFHIIL